MTARPFYSEDISRMARRLSASSYGKTKVHCPLCDPAAKRSKSLDINFLSGNWHCWRDVCAKWGKIDPDLYAHWLRKSPEQQAESALQAPKGYRLLSKVKDSLVAQPAIEFLEGRGILQEQWNEAQIGVTLDGPRYGRIIIPVLGADGATWQGWIGRVWTEKAPEGVLKYVYPRGMKRGEFLYNEAALYRASGQPCFVFEGALDTHHIWPGAVAVLGKHSKSHLELLTHTERPICVVYDGDYWRGSFQLAYALRLRGIRAGYLKLGSKRDPNNIDRNRLLELGSQAVWASSKEFFAQYQEEPIQ